MVGVGFKSCNAPSPTFVASRLDEPLVPPSGRISSSCARWIRPRGLAIGGKLRSAGETSKATALENFGVSGCSAQLRLSNGGRRNRQEHQCRRG